MKKCHIYFKLHLYLFITNFLNCQGYEGPQQFCATQWPLESTAVDFWKVILQEKSAAMVCLKNNIDEGKVIITDLSFHKNLLQIDNMNKDSSIDKHQ